MLCICRLCWSNQTWSAVFVRVFCSSCGRSLAGCLLDPGEQEPDWSSWSQLELWLTAWRKLHTQVALTSDPKHLLSWSEALPQQQKQFSFSPVGGENFDLNPVDPNPSQTPYNPIQSDLYLENLGILWDPTDNPGSIIRSGVSKLSAIRAKTVKLRESHIFFS